MTNRRARNEFSKRVKVQAKDRADGKCEQCGSLLMPGKYHYDHSIPTAIGGSNDVSNCNCVCVACHAAKTKLDAKIIAKARRCEEKHIGARKPKRGWKPEGAVYNWRKGRYEFQEG